MGIDKKLMGFNRIFIVMIMVVVLAGAVSADPDISVLDRLNNLGGSNLDVFYSVINSSDYYVAVGMSGSNLSNLTGGNSNDGSFDFIITKFFKSNLSLASINYFGSSGDDRFYSVIDSGDYYVAVGFSGSDLSDFTGGNNTTGNSDFVIAKFSKYNLSLVKINNLGGSTYEGFHSVIDSGDYYVAVGYSSSDLSGLPGGNVSAGADDFVIAKFYKTNLSLVNISNLGGSTTDKFNSVIDSGDYYVAVGYSSSDLSGLSGGNVSAGNDDFVIAKFYKTNLSLVNINNLGGSGSDYFEYVIDSGDYYVAVGRSNSDISHLSGGDNTAGYNDFVIAKFYKTNLSLVKINNLGGGSGDYFEYVIDSGDYYVAVGFSGSDLSDFTGGNNTTGKSGKYDFVIAKVLKSNLSLVSINNLGGSDYDKFYSFVVSGDYYIAVGGSYSDLSNLTGGANTSGSSDFVIAKFGAGSSLPTYTNFSPYSETTNFSAVDLTNVTSLTLAINNKGKITFPLNHSINSDGENYDTNIKIEDAMIFVNSSALHSSFNDSATLTFYYVDCNKPYVFYSETASLFAAVLSENQRCLAPLCTNITCEGSILTVNVDHFTGFAAGTNANLTIEAEAGVKYALDSIEFYAWYINKTDGTPISGECNITFDDDWGTWFEMDYNGSEYNYTKSSGFASAGTHDYNVTCSNASFVTLEANDTKVVSPTDIPEFSTITLGLGLIAVLAGLVMIRKRK